MNQVRRSRQRRTVVITMPLSEMSKKELLELAKNMGMSKYTTLNKENLFAAIEIALLASEKEEEIDPDAV